MIELKNLNKIYENGNHALKNIDLTFDKCGLNFIVGKSGSGKSTLLNVIGCLDSYENGEYYLNGKLVENNINQLDKYRSDYFGFVFQEYHLINDYDVYENVLMSFYGKEKKYDTVDEVISKLYVDEIKNSKSNEISGGQKQRVALARAVSKNPPIILADEPTGNLDEITKKAIYGIFKELSKEHLIIIVSHDSDAAEIYADRIIKLESGKIISDCANISTSFDIKIENEEYKNLNQIELLDVIKSRKSKEFDCSIKKDENVIDNRKLEVNLNLNDNSKEIKKDNFQFFKKELKINMKRLSLVSLTLIFVNLLMALFIYILQYDVDKTIYNYYVDNNINTAILYENVEYEDEFYSIKSKVIYSGKALYDKLSSDNYNINRVKEIYFTCNEVNRQTYLSINDNIDSEKVHITDYMSNLYTINLNDKVVIDGYEFTVDNIIQTNYKDYDVLESNQEQNYDKNSLEKNELLYMYCSSSSYKQISEVSTIQISCSDFINSKKFATYYQTQLEYSSLNNVGELISGRMPITSNEVVISTSYVEEYSTLLDKAYNFKDIYEDKYNGYYNDEINLYDYFKDGIKIVGVSANSSANVFINDEIYNQIEDNYIKYYDVDFFKVENISNYKSFFKVVKDCNLLFDESNIQFFYTNHHFIHGIGVYVLVGFIIFFIIDLLTIINFISTIINNDKKKIGILKSLGITNKNIRSVYLLFVTFFGVLFLACVSILYTLCYFIINVKIEKNIFYNSCFTMYFDFLSISSIWILNILVVSIVLLVLMYKTLKRKPISLLR